METSSFAASIVGLIPQLRAYAMSLTRSSAKSDDLVQDTLMRAWAYRSSFAKNADLKPWLFKILRTQLYDSFAHTDLMVEDVDGRFAEALSFPPDQDWHASYNELLIALEHLSRETREAVILVLAAGFTYEEAAHVCGCPVGTMKSRVSRGREQLVHLLEPQPDPGDGSPSVARRGAAAGGRRSALAASPGHLAPTALDIR
ncbi:MAG TPA: sigma-70 family RNA polymerase sigma factor [Phenylobacterium sp.]|nr:sigma-70 family RNA polymerase sigma factor [Phenylobacterium sp.]